MKILTAFFWLLVAIILSAILIPMAFIWGMIRSKDRAKWLMNVAESYSQHTNAYGADMFTDWWTVEGGYRFGNKDEPLSSALGKNSRIGKLNVFGFAVNDKINKIDQNHTINSIEENP